jgi:hypothetical protein
MKSQHNIKVGTIISPDFPGSPIAVLNKVKGFTRVKMNNRTGCFEAVTQHTLTSTFEYDNKGLVCFLDTIPDVLEDKNRLEVVAVRETNIYAKVIP